MMVFDIDFRPRAYCDVYKQLLVEEVYYISTPLHLHNGMCSVIGKITFENHRYLLQNIQLSCFDKAHQLRTGAISVLIIPRHHMDAPPINQYVEVFGEAVLWEQTVEVGDTKLPLTSAYLIEKLGELQVHLEREQGMPERQPTGMHEESMSASIRGALNAEIDAMKDKYVPAIYLDSYKVINEADEVILCNLELRALSMMIKK